MSKVVAFWNDLVGTFNGMSGAVGKYGIAVMMHISVEEAERWIEAIDANKISRKMHDGRIFIGNAESTLQNNKVGV